MRARIVTTHQSHLTALHPMSALGSVADLGFKSLFDPLRTSARTGSFRTMTFFDIVLIIAPVGLIFVGFRSGVFAVGNFSMTREEHPAFFWFAMSLLAFGLIMHLYSLVAT